MKPLCIVATADDGYQKYIPLFVYFALHAYPHYEVIIYLDGSLHPEVGGCLRSIRDMGSFDVRSLLYRYDANDPQSSKSLRWVLYDEDFAGYENVHIGDVDLLIVREEPTLCERRVRHSEEIGLPYSNRVRTGTKLLNGIGQFARTSAYFPRVLPLMLRYREQIANGSLQMHNEAFLYRMMEESAGLPERGRLDTHHGIHLRAFHRERSLAQQRERTDYLFKKVFETFFERFLEAARSERCIEMVRRLSLIESSPARLARYEKGGPGLGTQFRNVLSLCDEFIGGAAWGSIERRMPEDHAHSNAKQDVANLGVLRPPLVYFVSIVTGLLLDLARPIPLLPAGLAGPFGILLVVTALALFVYSVRTFRAAGTPVPGNKPTTAIVRSGPYRFTRNPIYVAFSILQLGVACWADSLWLIVTLIGSVVLMSYVVIPREERYLEKKFGREYLELKASVRRWL